MIISSITSGAPALITDYSAQIFGILGIAGFAVFALGGQKDNDGQGTNSSPYLTKPTPKKMQVKQAESNPEQ